LDLPFAHQNDFVDTVDFGQFHAHALAQVRWQILAHMVCADGKFSMPSVNDHCQSHGLRTTYVIDRVERRSYSATRKEHVID